MTLGYWAISASAANVIVKSDPARAHDLAPSDGAITADYAENEFALHQVSQDTSTAARLSREALSEDPTAVAALVVLGFQAQLRAETTRSDKIFDLAGQFSRRELRSQIWAIEEAVNRGDIAGALRHYDIGLRTSANAQTMFFPTLAAAVTEPRIRESLLRILESRPNWGDAFISYAASSGVAPEAAMRLFEEGHSFGLAVSQEQRADLVNSLLAVGKPITAWAYYEKLRPGAERQRSRDPHFANSTDTRARFDWQTGDDPGLSAAILKTGKAGLVDFAVPPSAGGVLVRQIQLLPPGRYRIAGQSRGVEQPEQSLPYWSLACQDGRELGRVTVPNSVEAGGRFAGRFSVPQDCAMQTLSLIARPSDQISGVSGQIVHTQLAPAD